MKKIFVFLLAVLLCLPSCAGIGDDPTETERTVISGDEEIHTDFEGVYLTLDSVCETSLSVTWHNDSEYEMIFGEEYKVELLSADGSWNSVLKDLFSVEAIALLLPSGGEIKKGYSLKPFDVSALGRYRLRCEFWYGGNTYNTWVEFEVGNEKAEYTGSVKLTRYDWSGYGISYKTIDPCVLADEIIGIIQSMPQTNEKSVKIADGVLEEYYNAPPVERGTSWVEVGSKIYRLDSEMTEISIVERHLGEGKKLESDSDIERLAKLLHQAWYYHPYNYYSGSFDNSTGKISLDCMYEAESNVDIKVKSFKVEKEFNSVNSVTVELTAKADVEVRLVLDSRQSDDNLGAGDLKEISMKKGETQTVTLSFSGWQYSYWVYIKADNTMISMQINP